MREHDRATSYQHEPSPNKHHTSSVATIAPCRLPPAACRLPPSILCMPSSLFKLTYRLWVRLGTEHQIESANSPTNWISNQYEVDDWSPIEYDWREPDFAFTAQYLILAGGRCRQWARRLTKKVKGGVFAVARRTGVPANGGAFGSALLC